MVISIKLPIKALCAISVILMSMICINVTPVFAIEKVCFPDHKGLPHHGNLAPTIDGYVARELAVATSELEQGWNGSSMVSYGRGGSISDVEIRGIQDNAQPFIYLSFVVRFDESFDDRDTIVILLRSTSPGATHSVNERRIHISPLYEGAGAGNPDNPASYTTASASGYTIRKNAQERIADFYKWQAGNFVSIARPSNLDIKVRSWEGADKNWSVEMKVPTTIAAVGGIGGGGVDWIDIGTDFGLYYNVIRVCDTCLTEPVTGYYSNQFTWPRADYTATPPTGLLLDPLSGPVNLHEIAIEPGWLGPAKLINMATADCGAVRIAGGHSGIGVRQTATGPTGTSIHATNANTFVAKLVNDGTDAADGVRAEFRIANWGIASGAPGVWEKFSPDPGFSNPTARTMIPVGGGITELTTRWTLSAAQKAQYGSTLSTHQCVWVVLDSNMDVNFSQSNFWNNMSLTGLSSVSRLAEINTKNWGPAAGPEGKQQFRLRINQRYLFHPGLKKIPDVLVSATEPRSIVHKLVTGPDIIEIEGIFDLREEIVRNIKANVKFGVFPKFTDSRDSQYFLLPEEEILLGELVKKPTQALWQWLWLASANRKTTHTLTLNNKKYRVYEPAGEFGHVGLHQGLSTNFSHVISNQIPQVPPSDLIELSKETGKNSYVMNMASEKSFKLSTQLNAEAMGDSDCKSTFCKKCPNQTIVSMSNILDGTFLIAGLCMIGLLGYRYKGRKK